MESILGGSFPAHLLRSRFRFLFALGFRRALDILTHLFAFDIMPSVTMNLYDKLYLESFRLVQSELFLNSVPTFYPSRAEEVAFQCHVCLPTL